jgi:hypothetical protein
VLKQRSSGPDLGQPRSVAEVLAAALSLYRRYPLLFIGLSLLVVVPYELAVLIVTKAAPLGQESASAGTTLTVALVDFALVGPFVSSLLVRAVLMIGEHEQPRFTEVIRRSVRVLPVVAAAEIIAGIGIVLGLIAFVVPGVILALRWAVVAQVAAVERTDWPTALRRSATLTKRNYLRILGILALIALVNLTLTSVVGQLVGTGRDPAQVVAGIAIVVIESSFQALTTAVLYFDLRAREGQARV